MRKTILFIISFCLFSDAQTLPSATRLKLRSQTSYVALVGRDEYCHPRELNLGVTQTSRVLSVYSQGEAPDNEAKAGECEKEIKWPMTSGVLFLPEQPSESSLLLSPQSYDLSIRSLAAIKSVKKRELKKTPYEGGGEQGGRKYIITLEKKGNSRLQLMNVLRDYKKTKNGDRTEILESFQMTTPIYGGEKVDPKATQRATFVVDLWVPTSLAARNGAEIVEILEVTEVEPVDITSLERVSLNSIENVVLDFYKYVINGHSNSRLNDLVSENFEDTTPYCQLCGRDDFRKFNEFVIKFIPDVNVTPHIISVNDQMVRVTGFVRGTVKGPTPMFGDQLGSATWIEDHEYLVSNGKIFRHWVSIRNTKIE